MSILFLTLQLLLGTFAAATSYAWLMSVLKKEVNRVWLKAEVLLTALFTLGSLTFFFTLETDGVFSTVAWLSVTVAGLNAVAASVGVLKDDPAAETQRQILLIFGSLTFLTLVVYLFVSFYLLTLS